MATSSWARSCCGARESVQQQQPKQQSAADSEVSGNGGGAAPEPFVPFVRIHDVRSRSDDEPKSSEAKRNDYAKQSLFIEAAIIVHQQALTNRSVRSSSVPMLKGAISAHRSISRPSAFSARSRTDLSLSLFLSYFLSLFSLFSAISCALNRHQC
jgi:hypothetical protein